jgi:hypothetical protein
MLTVTNAVKAQIAALVNAVLGCMVAFNVGSLTQAKEGAIILVANSVLGLLVAVTYKSSSKRLPDGQTATAAPVVVAAPTAPVSVPPVVP